MYNKLLMILLKFETEVIHILNLFRLYLIATDKSIDINIDILNPTNNFIGSNLQKDYSS